MYQIIFFQILLRYENLGEHARSNARYIHLQGQSFAVKALGLHIGNCLLELLTN